MHEQYHDTCLMQLIDKLSVLADAAKYDVSCASSGAPKRSSKGRSGLGATDGMGICHSFTPDGRCVALLKILLTNFCLYDCQYCVNRRSSDVPRARFTPEEVVTLTLDFYRRNCISGLFLSSGIIRSADYTMEQLNRVARLAARGARVPRLHPPEDHPGRRPAADRRGRPLRRSAQRQHRAAYREQPDPPRAGEAGRLHQAGDAFDPSRRNRSAGRKAGTILHTAQSLYGDFRLRRVYYSAFSPIPHSPKTVPFEAPPLLREHRLYQADFLMRGYGFRAGELLAGPGNLPLDIDPKLAWALANREHFPVDLNRAEPSLIARVPGIGILSAKRLVALRRQKRIRFEDLTRLRCSLEKAKPFVITQDYRPRMALQDSTTLRQRLGEGPRQMALW